MGKFLIFEPFLGQSFGIVRDVPRSVCLCCCGLDYLWCFGFNDSSGKLCHTGQDLPISKIVCGAS